MTTATWIAIALLAPFWWATGFLALSVLGSLSPWWSVRISGPFDSLERA